MEHNEYNLISGREIAELFGVSRAWVYRLSETEGFPKPVYMRKRSITLWRLADIKAWALANNYLEVY